ncbi:hypothetical protein MOV98_17485 (plasmid) [Acinetobacter variabilis]|nr:hypothetical protein MOV98_17485 [Acinetobacter variabilis]
MKPKFKKKVIAAVVSVITSFGVIAPTLTISTTASATGIPVFDGEILRIC